MTTLIERLAEAVPAWGAKAAYGEKTSVGGEELVPVAVVGFGFGGGEGSGESQFSEASKVPAGHGEGSGGGGGGYAVPIGAYAAGPGGVSFRANPIALIVVLVPLVTGGGFALAQIVRALRGR